MKKLKQTLLASFLVWSSISGADDSFGLKALPILKIESPVTVDGKFDEPCWKQASWVDDFVLLGKEEKPQCKTEFAAAYDEKNLYVAVVCHVPGILQAAPQEARDTQSMFQGEVTELFIDPSHDHQTYYQVAVDNGGTIWDSRGADPKWDSNVQRALTSDEHCWRLELVLPWSDVQGTPEPGHVIGFNLCRESRNEVGREYTEWSATKEGFHDPPLFGHLVLSPSIEQMGKLRSELRKGGRTGKLQLSGSADFVKQVSLLFARNALADLDGGLSRLERERDAETQESLRRVLGQIAQTIRGTTDPLRSKIQTTPPDAGTDLLAAEHDLNLSLAGLESRTAIWKARLDDLLAQLL